MQSVADITHVTRCGLQKLITLKNQCQIVILHVKVYQRTKYYQPSPIHVLTTKKKRLKVTQNGYVADITHVTRWATKVDHTQKPMPDCDSTCESVSKYQILPTKSNPCAHKEEKETKSYTKWICSWYNACHQVWATKVDHTQKPMPDCDSTCESVSKYQILPTKSNPCAHKEEKETKGYTKWICSWYHACHQVWATKVDRTQKPMPDCDSTCESVSKYQILPTKSNPCAHNEEKETKSYTKWICSWYHACHQVWATKVDHTQKPMPDCDSTCESVSKYQILPTKSNPCAHKEEKETKSYTKWICSWYNACHQVWATKVDHTQKPMPDCDSTCESVSKYQILPTKSNPCAHKEEKETKGYTKWICSWYHACHQVWATKVDRTQKPMPDCDSTCESVSKYQILPTKSNPCAHNEEKETKSYTKWICSWYHACHQVWATKVDHTQKPMPDCDSTCESVSKYQILPTKSNPCAHKEEKETKSYTEWICSWYHACHQVWATKVDHTQKPMPDFDSRCESVSKCQILQTKSNPIHVFTKKIKRLIVTQNGYVADIMHVTRCELQK